MYIYGNKEVLHQWDLNQKVVIENKAVEVVQFTNGVGKVLNVDVIDGMANIPNILLQQTYIIKAYGYCGECVRESLNIVVLARKKPDDYIYTETDVKTWEDLEQEINKNEAKIEEQAKEIAAAANIANNATTHTASYDGPDNSDIWFNFANRVKAGIEVLSQTAGNIIGIAINEVLNNKAARYNTIEDALAETNSSTLGKILGYYCGNEYHLMLLDNITITTETPINRDCTLHLNGKTLAISAIGAYLDITAENVTIDGAVDGSEMTINLEALSTKEKIIKATGGVLTLNGGKYSGYGKYQTLVMFRVDDTKTTLNMNSCVVRADITDTTNFAGIQSKGSFNINNCDFYTKMTRSGAMFIFRTATGSGKVEINNTKVDLDSYETNTGTGRGAMYFTQDNFEININNCYITVKDWGERVSVYGIYLDKKLVAHINNCYITADGMSDMPNEQGETTAYGVYPISVIGTETTAYINNCYCWGGRDGLETRGTTYINGGVYEGLQHGGGYLGGVTRAKNAVFRCTNLKPEFPISKLSHELGYNSRGGMCYCGTGTGLSYTSFENCRFENSSKLACSHGLVAKINTGVTKTEVYISNCEVVGANGNGDLRADANCVIYVGENNQYDSILANRAGVGPNGEGYGRGTVDTTTYPDGNYSFETEEQPTDAILSVKDSRGNWIDII